MKLSMEEGTGRGKLGVGQYIGVLLSIKRIRVMGQNIINIRFICSLTMAKNVHFGPRGRAKSFKN